MLQIGEFSRICQVSVKTLRHYDKLGLLVPARIDPQTGYRYYRAEQIDAMNYIQRLKRYGFSLEEILQITALSEPHEISRRLRMQQEALLRERRKLDSVLRELQTHLTEFERTGDIMNYQKAYAVVLRDAPAMDLLSVRARMSVDEYGKYFGTLYERAAKERVTPTGRTGARYFDTEFDRDCSDIEVFLEIREREKADAITEPCPCAMTVHRGGYATLSEAYGAVVSWIMENDYEIAGPPFDLYVKSRLDTPSPEAWETEVYFPVRKKQA
ncbi:MAG: MerR family transcriptional regulator [Oscillospiraceae bacterium]|nr:MerR family transcriptional regulator [Oscillospiraceae bacterium]